MDLTQPWHAPANQAAASAVLKVYQSPADTRPDNRTHYRVFVGPGTAFEDRPPDSALVMPRDFPDGTSNTICIAESAESVPWASPQEMKFQANAPLPPLGHPTRSVILLGMCDGSIRSVPKAVNTQTINDAITRNGNEMLPVNW